MKITLKQLKHLIKEEIESMSSPSVLETLLTELNETLGLDLVRTYNGDELKGVKINHEDGGTCKFYLNSNDCRDLAEAFSKLSEILLTKDSQ